MAASEFFIGVRSTLIFCCHCMPAPDRSTVRYLMPYLMFGIILITDYLVDLNWYRLKPLLVILVCVVIGTSVIPKLARSRTALPVADLDTFLVDHHLQNGYGPDWLASLTTVHTQELVTIRPVISPNNDYIQPFHWLAENDWFASKATFLAYDRGNSFNISADVAIKTFIEPDDTYRIDNYLVLVWNRNITPALQHPESWKKRFTTKDTRDMNVLNLFLCVP